MRAFCANGHRLSGLDSIVEHRDYLVVTVAVALLSDCCNFLFEGDVLAVDVKLRGLNAYGMILGEDNQKMSKSLGNFFTVRDAAAKFGYLPIRFFLLSAHYRTPVNFSADTLAAAKSSLERIFNANESLAFYVKNAPAGELSADVKAKLDAHKEKFITVMDDDFNTADGTATIFELVSDVFQWIKDGVSVGSAEAALDLLNELEGIKIGQRQAKVFADTHTTIHAMPQYDIGNDYYTYCADLSGLGFNRAIDHVYAMGEGIDIMTFDILDNTIAKKCSDHCPIVVDLWLK